MAPHSPLETSEANEAAWEATRGAFTGAARWGAVAAVFGGAAQYFSPLYKGMTIQFKIYIQMSGMVFGSMIEADSRLREYEARMRMQRRIQRDRAKWREFEEAYSEPEPETKKSEK
ncbi:hypothetical protein ACHAQA_001607 [Verticillium albo-atrum]